MQSIDLDAYEKTLESLATKKWNTLKGERGLSRMAKTQAFLYQRGFEPQLIQPVIQKLNKKNWCIFIKQAKNQNTYTDVSTKIICCYPSLYFIYLHQNSADFHQSIKQRRSKAPAINRKNAMPTGAG